jgi:signal transduction histidine kinase/ABC-type uncharacterized transport system substrate-binding protein
VAHCQLVRAEPPDSPKSLLVLQSEEQTHLASVEILAGIRENFGPDAGRSVTIYVEYIGQGLFTDVDYYRKLREWYRDKYRANKVDVIIAGGNLPLKFLLEARDELWADVPIVYGLIDAGDSGNVQPIANATGFLTTFDFKGTIDAAIKLLPKTRRLALVSGVSLSEQLLRSLIDRDLQQFGNRLDLIDLTGLPLEELSRRVSSLPEHTIILFVGMQLDKSGGRLVGRDVLPSIAQVANSPIFGAHDYFMGGGIVGGVLFNFREAGAHAGRLARSILDGEPLERIPVKRTNISQLVFDWRQLKKWGISENKLPPGASVLFREPTVWEQYKFYVFGAVFLTILQALFISVLLVEQRKRRRVQLALDERLRFEAMLSDLSADFANLPAGEVDAEIEAWLKKLTEFLGVDRSMIMVFSENGKSLSVTHLYSAPNAPIADWATLAGDYPLYMARLLSQKPLVFSKLPNELPPEATVIRDYVLESGMKSHIGIPMSVGGEVISALSISSFRSYREWPDELVQRLRIVGEIFANAIARKIAGDRTDLLNQNLAHVSRVMTMGELAASIAHEVNQPLTAVVTNADLCLSWVKEDSPKLAELQAALEDIIRDSERASDVIGRIWEMMTKSAPVKTGLDINEVLNEVISLLRKDIIRKNISLRMDLATGLPPVLGDRIQLQQVFLNLLINAIEAVVSIEDGKREVSISSSLCETDGVMVTISDTGPGLPPDDAERIFEPFHTTKPDGMGMGLSINRTIITAHGGKLWAAPNDEAGIKQGATFHVTLPASPENTE